MRMTQQFTDLSSKCRSKVGSSSSILWTTIVGSMGKAIAFNIQYGQTYIYHDGWGFSEGKSFSADYWGSISPQTSIETHTHDLLLKMLVRSPVHCTVLVISPATVYFTRARSDQKWIIAAISELELPCPHLPVLIECKKRLHGLVDDESFTILQTLSQRRKVTSHALLYRYVHGMCSYKIHSFVSILLTSATGIYVAIYTRVIHPSSHRISIVSSKFHSDIFFFSRTATFWNSLSQSLQSRPLQM